MPAYEFSTGPDGQAVFRKYTTAAPDPRFHAEAEGLAALAASGTVRTPAVVAVDDRELLTERIPPGSPTPQGWGTLGRQLGKLHTLTENCFGFTTDNFCGDTPQPNPRLNDGYEFFARHRLGYQGRLARDAGLLEPAQVQALEQLCGRLRELVPEQGPALLHGDLWNGNVLFDESGRPVVIDPACYWGWPEADVAMCALFGGFPEHFYQAWEETWQPAPGWRERLPIYSLYHVLNHLNLFGSGYRAQALAVIGRYS
ncbi:MAG: fructosamine kinase family protein [Halieaceae bacterium]|jgi:fructosamine-3-kinase|nr:fructosamine kinase family protein [Halieaceae bacterium]